MAPMVSDENVGPRRTATGRRIGSRLPNPNTLTLGPACAGLFF